MGTIIKNVWLNPKDILFRIYLRCNRLLNIPNMTYKERNVIKNILNGAARGHKINILEWGSGSSTVYFSKYLEEAGVEFDWYSMENSPRWYNHVLNQVRKRGLDAKAHIYLFDFKPFWERPAWDWSDPNPRAFGPVEETERRYILFPGTLGLKFDVIIIDGRFRRRCLIEAQKILSPAGCVILHDAQKERYHSPLGLYGYGEFFESKHVEIPCLNRQGGKKCKLWVGREIKNGEQSKV